MNVDNAKSQMRKGMLEYCIMLLLRDRQCYSSDIIGRLKDANLLVVEGTLYPLLTRLKNDGLLSYQWQESLQGPPRKYYALTDDGRLVLEQLDLAWTELAGTVNSLKTIETTPAATSNASNASGGFISVNDSHPTPPPIPTDLYK